MLLVTWKELLNMRFLPKTTCEKLVKMGCETRSYDFYFEDNVYPITFLARSIESNTSLTRAFTLEDFVSTDEYAKENCRKLFGAQEHSFHSYSLQGFSDPDICKCGAEREGSFYDLTGDYCFETRRLYIITSKDWVEFISKAVEERSKTL